MDYCIVNLLDFDGFVVEDFGGDVDAADAEEVDGVVGDLLFVDYGVEEVHCSEVSVLVGAAVGEGGEDFD